MILYGLYDTDGILRFFCSDKEACIAYAELFDLPSIEYSLMPFPEQQIKEKAIRIKGFQKRTHQAKNNN
tara:strand:- start:38 stop:244 length:207 start_codon:yes stop_codon:yes gene_type:complete